MPQTSRNKGIEAESACCDYLCQNGLKLITKNYRGKRGEIDLVMQDKNTLVFIEVRYRKNNDYGDALESVTYQKQKKILMTAEQYMQQETKLNNARIDVVAMTQNTHNEYTFNWIRNAF